MYRFTLTSFIRHGFRMDGFFRWAKDARRVRVEVERVNWKLISETRIHSFVYLFRVKTNVSAEGLLRFVISIEF